MKATEESCPVCQAPVRRFLHNQANYFGCPSCGSWLLIEKGQLKPTKVKKSEWSKTDPLFVGTRVRFENTDFVVVGATQKADIDAKQFTWKEYSLFHPAKGYRFLSEFEGHWMLLRETNPPAKTNSRVKNHNGREYRLFQRGRSMVLNAVGEFPFDVVKAKVSYEEYIDPPGFLGLESGGGYHEWYSGEYLQPDALLNALQKKDIRLPKQNGVGMIQPATAGRFGNLLLRVSVFAALLIFAVVIINAMAFPKKTIASYNGITADSAAFVSPAFLVDNNHADLHFAYSSPVSNNWSEGDIMLINDLTGETRGLTMGVEYYHGVEDGESWSEGETETDMYLSNVSAGKYHFNIKTNHGSSGSGGASFSLIVTENEIIPSNIFISLLLLSLFPAISYWRTRQFEKQRWSNSDYSPYDSE